MRSHSVYGFRAAMDIRGIADAGIEFDHTEFVSVKGGRDMSRSAVRALYCSLLVCFFILAGLYVPAAWGQSSSTGTISVTVLDPDGRTVPDAQLTLQDLSTNDVRRGTTQANGTYSFRQPVPRNLQAHGFEGRL